MTKNISIFGSSGFKWLIIIILSQSGIMIPFEKIIFICLIRALVMNIRESIKKLRLGHEEYG